MRSVEEAAAVLRDQFGEEPPVLCVVLGSGLGSVAETLEGGAWLPAGSVPGFAPAGVEGHSGRVACGSWGGRRALVFQGRAHLYEGHPVEAVTLPVRAAAAFGARNLILTNAAGSCDRLLPPGALMRAVDLLDLFFRRIRGSRGKPYLGRDGALDPALGSIVEESARDAGIRLEHGVLCGSLGPSYETRAEARMLRSIGVGAACMSTIPEAWAACDLGMRVAVVSLITNYATGVGEGSLDHAEVVSCAERGQTSLARLLQGVAGRL